MPEMNSTTKPATHTAGPWRAEFSPRGGYDCMTDAWKIRSDARASIATLDCNYYGQTPGNATFDNEIARADARLLAAAPDLLAALKDMLTLYEAGGLEGVKARFDAARAVIARVEGRETPKRESSRPCGCDPGEAYTCAQHRTEQA